MVPALICKHMLARRPGATAEPGGCILAPTRRPRLIPIFVAALACIPATVLGQAPPATAEVLRPGDELRIQVWRQPEFSGAFPVTDQGFLAHPLYRKISVGGQPVAEAEAALRAFLSDYEADPQFVVEGFFRVAVGGEVRQPNMQLLRPGTTVAEAVAQAGGASERGRLDKVTLRRGGADYLIDLTLPSSSLRNTTIRSGDEIMVARSGSVWREYILPTVSVLGSFASIYRVFR